MGGPEDVLAGRERGGGHGAGRGGFVFMPPSTRAGARPTMSFLHRGAGVSPAPAGVPGSMTPKLVAIQLEPWDSDGNVIAWYGYYEGTPSFKGKGWRSRAEKKAAKVSKFGLDFLDEEEEGYERPDFNAEHPTTLSERAGLSRHLVAIATRGGQWASVGPQ